MKSIAEDTPIIPDMVADAVVREVELWSGAELPARSVLVQVLVDRAETVYQNNDRFRRSIRSQGNKGRDTLYAFMRHWLTGQVNWYVNGKRLPDSFANGIELQGRAQ